MTAFRISQYLPLAIATAALGYAEGGLLPEVGVFAVVVLVALVVIFRLEPRLRTLTDGEFNRLGACIGVGVFLWAGFRVVREVSTGEFTALGWTAFILALVAPVLLAAMCALLLRGHKKDADHWFLHGAGLAAIILAGAMAEQSAMIAFTAAYALCEVWFLSQFFRARFHEASATGSSQLGRAALWLAGAAAVAVPLFLLTPRSPFDKLEFGNSRIEIGYAADQMIDLTQTGELQENPETAFEVQANHADGRPKEDLPGDVRWRGSVLVAYSGGTWRRDLQAQFPTMPTTIISRPREWSPPDLGAGAFKLEFTVPLKLRSAFLLDPVPWEPGTPAPVADFRSQGPPEAWLPFGNGLVFSRGTPLPGGTKELRYVQHSRLPAEPDLSPAYPFTPEINRALLANPLPGLKDYTDRVVNEMAAAGRLPAAAAKRDEVRLLPHERHHEAIARALRDHLSENSDLSYTTNLKRVNRAVDPVEDFLFHSKAGHCERFATALVLMLRSQGIPAVLVLGFKGCEHVGGGKYVVRQEFAHAWAEALIMRPTADPRRPALHWLGLDASPVQERATATAADSSRWILAAPERFIFKFSAEDRRHVLAWIGDTFQRPEAWAILAGLAVATVVARRARRRWAKSHSRPPESDWFDRLRNSLARFGLAPEPGETAREFAARAATSLPAEFAAVPACWVESHYRERFGRAAATDDERADLEHQLQELARLPERRS
ncbi:MAG: transglutaminaseTgpA domain-containing protein [Gemmataceae bacterium]